jgi:hypothetical protein
MKKRGRPRKYPLIPEVPIPPPTPVVVMVPDTPEIPEQRLREFSCYLGHITYGDPSDTFVLCKNCDAVAKALAHNDGTPKGEGVMYAN